MFEIGLLVFLFNGIAGFLIYLFVSRNWTDEVNLDLIGPRLTKW
jgi:hypothetical protein